MDRITSRTAEHVCRGHPDKFCDQVADRILDAAYAAAGELPAPAAATARAELRTAIEVLAKGEIVVVSGEVRLPPEIQGSVDVPALVREVYTTIGYPGSAEDLAVHNYVQEQAKEIRDLVDSSSADPHAVGAGDQGIMVGYATDETAELMPLEWVLARDICRRLREVAGPGQLGWVRPDGKSQVTLDGEGRIKSAIVAVQHAPDVCREEIEHEIRGRVLEPVLGDLAEVRVVINGGGGGTFIDGGPVADAGTVGRKIVVDAYGPRVPVGGGAYSGKDPSKVDRSAAYMARHIAKTIVAHQIGGAHECTVSLAFAIGQHQPEMVTARTDCGKDLSEWVRTHFRDLSPGAIIERLGLTNPRQWSYLSTAFHGHYGRSEFPWEAVAELGGER